MTDHYLAYLNAEVRELRHEVGRLQGRLDLAHAARDEARQQVQAVRDLCDSTLKHYQPFGGTPLVNVTSILRALQTPGGSEAPDLHNGGGSGDE